MRNNKVFILLPDGVGLRNFAYTDFYKKAEQQGLDLVFWNITTFDLSSLGFREIRIENPKFHPITDILKKARVQIDLSLNAKKENDDVYDHYRFPLVYKGAANMVKMLSIRLLMLLGTSNSGNKKIRSSIFGLERKTAYYKACVQILQEEKPAMIFCTNQRTVSAIAPILAAKDLGIPTATFIFSWDNLPKATLVLEPDYYFVWSDYMKKELLHYYPFVKENQVVVTGTPQFEVHTYGHNIESKEVFYKRYGLDLGRRYICYSGDDITTSPNDPQYLEDTVNAVRKLNAEGQNIGIVFRRCPVDFSDRYDAVLQKNADIITPIDPKWKRIGEHWNMILPTKEDMDLHMNTIAHTEMVINLGSSMVFDYISFNKPCAYLNYDVPTGLKAVPVKNIYNFVHFRSMPSQDAVLWIDSPEMIPQIIVKGLEASDKTREHAQHWFERINLHPTADASSRIVKAMQDIIEV